MRAINYKALKTRYKIQEISIKSFILMIIMLITAPALAQKADRSKVPPLGKPKKLSLPAIQSFELSNGLNVVLMEKHSVPLVHMNVIVKSGVVNDPEGKSGLASMTADLLDEGAAGKSSLELADQINYLGVRISTFSRWHKIGLNLHSPLSKFDEALKIAADILLHPDFLQKELDRIRKEKLTSLLQWHDQANTIASVTFQKILFGENHPYGRPAMGNEASIKSFSVDDLKSFHRKYFKANNAYVIVVGNITKAQLVPKLESVFGKWERGDVPVVKLKDAEQVKKRVIYLVDKPGSAQSVISIGRIGTKRVTDDYFPITVMNTILGGSFTSRLNNNLREQHGYTYGAGSSFDMRHYPGPFVARSSVQTEVTDKALVEFFKELNGITKPVPEEELTRAKNYVALGYPDNFQTVAEIAANIEEMADYNLPGDYFNNYIDNVLNVNAGDVSKVSKRYIVPDKMAVIVVGDRSKIEEGIRKLNIGEIKHYKIEEVLGKKPQL
ncbi:MAG: pitrilysin family protein [Bacteroidota bacterium]